MHARLWFLCTTLLAVQRCADAMPNNSGATGDNAATGAAHGQLKQSTGSAVVMQPHAAEPLHQQRVGRAPPPDPALDNPPTPALTAGPDPQHQPQPPPAPAAANTRAVVASMPAVAARGTSHAAGRWQKKVGRKYHPSIGESLVSRCMPAACVCCCHAAVCPLKHQQLVITGLGHQQ